MSQSAPEHQTPSRSRLLLIGGVAAAAVIATVVAIAVSRSGDDSSDPTIPTTAATDTGSVTELTAGHAMDMKCMAPTAASAAKQSVAFEGVVTEIADGTVTLRPLHFYTGTETSRVRITEPDQRMSEGPVPFEIGQTYVVGAKDGQVAICGLTGPADDELRALYAEAFGD